MRADFLKELEGALIDLAGDAEDCWDTRRLSDQLRALARRVAVELEQQRLRGAA